jgi:phage/plasmid-associated DNA primase
MTHTELYNLHKVYYLYEILPTLSDLIKDAAAIKKFLIDIIEANGILKVSYSTTQGRSFAKSSSIQRVSSKVRNFLFADSSIVDVDIVNCAISVFTPFFKKYNLNGDTFSAYLNNRQQIIDEVYHGDKAKAKLFINVALFKPAEWIKPTNSFEAKFKQELQELQTHIVKSEDLKSFYNDAVAKCKSKNTDNVIGTMMSMVYHHFENQILNIAMDFYESKSNNKIMTKMFDGWLAEQSTPYDLTELNNFVSEQIQIPIKFIYKPIVNEAIPPIPLNYVSDMKKIKDNVMLDKVEQIKDYDVLSNRTLSIVFLKLYGHNYLFNNDKYYYFNGMTWDMEVKPYKLKKDILENLLNIYAKLQTRNFTSSNADDKMEKAKNLNKIYVSLGRTLTTVKDIADFVVLEIKNDDIQFDVQLPYVICFKNRAVDVRTNLQVIPVYSDYCSFTTGYDYVKPTETDMNIMNDIILSIFPNTEIRKTYLSILWTGLTAIRQEKFFMANGGGRNGKGMLNELMIKTLGPQYAYTGHISTLTKEMKSGPTPEISQLSKKRFVKWEEPNETDLLNLGNIKKITGEGKLNSRECNSNNTECYLFLSAIFECNAKPNLNGSIDKAIVDRFVLVFFESYFTNNAEELQSNPAARPINLELKQASFQEKMRCALFDYLVLNASNELYIADVVKTRTRNYLLDNDDMYTWLVENYCPCVEDNPITIKALYKHYKASINFNNLTKNAKKSCSEKNFKDRVASHLELKSFYKERYQAGGLNMYSVILNWKKNITEDLKIQDDDELN